MAKEDIRRYLSSVLGDKSHQHIKFYSAVLDDEEFIVHFERLGEKDLGLIGSAEENYSIKRGLTTRNMDDELWNIVLYNNDITEVDFVVDVLIKFIGMGEEQARTMMFKVHNEGKAICATLIKNKAIQISNNIKQYCQENNNPLVCNAKPVKLKR